MFLLLNLIKSEPIVEDNPSSIATNSEDIKSELTDTSPEFVHNQTRLRKAFLTRVQCKVKSFRSSIQ